MVLVPPLARIDWPRCYRIVPTKFPKIDLFEDVATSNDLEDVLAIYAFGNDRIREELGLLHRVPQADRISGAGTAYIMAAFTHVNPSGSRFSDGSFGVYYTSKSVSVCIAETQYHLTKFYLATRETAGEFDQRVLEARLHADLHDLRGRQSEYTDVYSPTSYTASQELGRRVRAIGSRGLAFDSVRASGECAAVLRPPALSHCRETTFVTYLWDGARFTGQYEKRLL